jgi:GTPase SAR1 family protein
MSDNEKVELRVFLIGDQNCGKKTIINRFKILKSTDTREKKQIEKHNSSKKLELIISGGAGNSMGKIMGNMVKNSADKRKKEEENNNNKNFNQIREKKKVIKLEENTYDNNSNSNNNIYLKSKDQGGQSNFQKNKSENLSNFTKIFNLAKVYFEMNFYNCPSAESIDFNDKVNEEEEAETLYRMRLEKLKRFLKIEINKPNKNGMKIKYLLIFVYDITNKQSLKRLKVYYDEINKLFLIENQYNKHHANYFRVLLGNKIDLKIPYSDVDHTFLSDFIQEKKIKHYEISGKLNFNFDKFFEKMFFEVIGEGLNENINTDYFKNRFSKMLNSTRTFSKETRDFFKFNDNPGPGGYNNNQFELNSEKRN